MKRNIYNNLILIVLSFVGAFSLLTGCQKDEGTGSVMLEAFGPCPILRGTELTLIGTNMDKVESVVIPSGITITDINVISSDKISVMVPQNAEVGPIIINYPDGTITSKALLSYSEPYSISSIAPLTAIKAGDVVTINGDYLNNIVSVVFNSGAEVGEEDFISRSRTKIEVNVPLAAKTGKIIIKDADGNELYSDQQLTISQHAIASVSPVTPVKTGQTLTITGTNLGVVKSVTFTGGAKLDKTEFKSLASTKIEVTVPSSAKDGPVTLTSLSGLDVTSAQSITLVVPSSLGFAAGTVFKAGNIITITGDDLDLVTSLSFSTAVDASFTKTTTSLTTTIPATAVDGVITLTTAAGKNVVTPAITLVKPQIASITPLSIIAGEQITVAGTNLDLVEGVKINGTVCTIVSQSLTAILISVPLTATSGDLVISLPNGTSVTSASQVTVTPATKPTVLTMPAKARPGEEITLTGMNLNNVESVYFGTVKVTTYSTRTYSTLTFTIPKTAPLGAQHIKLVPYEGSEVLTTNTISLTGQEPIVDPTLVFADFEDVSWEWGLWGGVGSIVSEDGNRYYKGSATGALSGVWIWANNNIVLPGCPNTNDYVLKYDIKVTSDFVLGAYAVQMALAGNWGWCTSGFFPLASDGVTCSTGGGWMTMTVDFPTLGISSAPATGKFDTGMFINSSAFNWANVCLDNFRYQHK
ncbi:MAG: glycan-binding surface protein [Rikenellaceae bacterium]|nr:glycan-binding surface protein [Rikenellaceae bacterium]